MAITIKHKDVDFSVGDRIKVTQKIKEGDKERSQVFDGMVIAIKNKGENKSFTVRRIGVQQVGIERIYPLSSPSIVGVDVVRKGGAGVRRSKLYFVRDKSKKEIEKIYSRVGKKGQQPKASKGKSKSKPAKQAVSKAGKNTKAGKATPKKKNAQAKSKK